jgi:malonyl-CoA/methylmalonyl-CoA synthetase
MDLSDRASFVPKHRGPNILPNSPFFSRLLRFAYRNKGLAINDTTAGFTASHLQLLTDVLHLRNVFLDSLDEFTLAQLERGVEVFIIVLGPGGYEFVVAFFAVIAIGAVVVPLGKLYFEVGRSPQ